MSNISTFGMHSLRPPLKSALRQTAARIAFAEEHFQSIDTKPFTTEKRRTFAAWVAQLLPHYPEDKDTPKFEADIQMLVELTSRSAYHAPYTAKQRTPRFRAKATTTRFISYLESLDSQALAVLRAGIGCTPPGFHPSLRIISKLLYPKTSRWSRHSQVVVAQLFAVRPKHLPGVALCGLAAKVGPMRTRFHTLLGDGKNEVLPRLTDLFRDLPDDVGVDYGLLLEDLQAWPSQRVTDRWLADLESV